MKKKLLAALMATTLVLTMAGCGAKEEAAEAASSAASSASEESASTSEESASSTEEAAAESASAADSDLAYIQEKGVLIVGITDFAPMDYPDDSGEWIGFDADLAKAVAADMGVDVQFVEIDWDNKILELDSKSIDCVWNGMTLTNEVKSAMECSNPYCNNAQIVILPADVAADYPDTESLKELSFAVESGSAGEAIAEELGLNYTGVTAQSDTLLEVSAGTSDAAIIDSLMAGAMVGEGTDYADLTYTLELTTEEYGIGCRKGSDLAAFLNEELAKYYADGTIEALAETYGLQAALIAQ